MKKYFTLTIVIILTLLWSCKKETTVNYVLLSGDSNTKGGKLRISSLNGDFFKNINVTDTGSFSDTLFIEKNGIYTIDFYKVRFAPYLSRGAKIHLEVDAKQRAITLLKSTEDDYAELNNYFVYRYGKKNDFGANYKVDESTFEAETKAFQKDLEDRLEVVKNIPKDIKDKEMRAINYSRLLKKRSYEGWHGELNKIREFKASDTFKKELEELSFDSGEDYLYSYDYRQMVKIDFQKRIFSYNDSLSYPEAWAKVFSEANQAIKNGALYDNIYSPSMGGGEYNKDAVAKLLNESTNKNHIAIIKESIESLKKLDVGQPSAKFNYENYAGGTTSLDDLKGKYVYIDVWATWCGPCKSQIPFLQKVEKQYHGKNIHFVSISVDKQQNKEKWRKMIANKKLGGIQLITDNDFSTPFISSYKITGIPQFILLDPEGNIVKANAPRPSNKKLIELFNELNI